MSWLGRIFGRGGVDLPAAPVAPLFPRPSPLTPIALPDESKIWVLSPAGLMFIQKNENLKLKAYRDSAGIPTIGYGSIVIDGVKVKMGDTITPEKAAQALDADAAKFVYALRRLVRVDQTQKQIDSLTDFMYNIGSSGFASSSLLKTINAKQPVVADLFTRWNKVHDPITKQLVVVPGLTARREREFHLYTS